MGTILYMVGGLAAFICNVLIAIKAFGDKEKGGAVPGILSLLCGPYAWYWGWTNNEKHNTKMFVFGSIGGAVLAGVGQGIASAG